MSALLCFYTNNVWIKETKLWTQNCLSWIWIQSWEKLYWKFFDVNCCPALKLCEFACMSAAECYVNRVRDRCVHLFFFFFRLLLLFLLSVCVSFLLLPFSCILYYCITIPQLEFMHLHYDSYSHRHTNIRTCIEREYFDIDHLFLHDCLLCYGWPCKLLYAFGGDHELLRMQRNNKSLNHFRTFCL